MTNEVIDILIVSIIRVVPRINSSLLINISGDFLFSFILMLNV
jgi:hypothetical protein